MNAMLGTTRLPAVAVVAWSLALAACGGGPAPADDATAPPGGDAAEIHSGSIAARARAAAAVPGRDPADPTRSARAPDGAPGGACPSPADEPAPIDGGREVTPGPEFAATVQDLAPAPVPPESTGNPG
jgi:hypothetical protein